MFGRKLRKLAYGFLRVSLLRSDVERRGSGKVGGLQSADGGLFGTQCFTVVAQCNSVLICQNFDI